MGLVLPCPSLIRALKGLQMAYEAYRAAPDSSIYVRPLNRVTPPNQTQTGTYQLQNPQGTGSAFM